LSIELAGGRRTEVEAGDKSAERLLSFKGPAAEGAVEVEPGTGGCVDAPAALFLGLAGAR
jgi:hypothetical protein